MLYLTCPAFHRCPLSQFSFLSHLYHISLALHHHWLACPISLWPWFSPVLCLTRPICSWSCSHDSSAPCLICPTFHLCLLSNISWATCFTHPVSHLSYFSSLLWGCILTVQNCHWSCSIPVLHLTCPIKSSLLSLSLSQAVTITDRLL